jgi:hypothetical protein
MLGTRGRLVLELGESLSDIARHRQVDSASLVVPVESKTKVTGAWPFCGDTVETLESVGEMLGMFLACVLDSEVV